MFDKTKNYLEKNPNNRSVRAVRAIGAFATMYTGVYLMQHGLDPNLSKIDTTRAVISGFVSNIPFVDNNHENKQIG
ncbi:MAG TPA: hypothetical protein VMV24_03020 [Candidatus Dormibacteraeota bacterium]|nr:hypothetical protein [Candidatus Dormibacteraeota bacterium]